MTVNRFVDSTRRSGATCGTAVLGALAVFVAAYAVAQAAQADTGRHESDVVVAPDNCVVAPDNCTVYGSEYEGLAGALDIAELDGEHKYLIGYSLKWTRPLSFWSLKVRSPVTLRYWDCKHRLLKGEEDQIVTLGEEFVYKRRESCGALLVIEPPKEARYVQIEIGRVLFTPRVALPMPKPAHGK